MALSFGNLVKPSSQTMPLSFGYPLGDTRADKSIYDDGILRAARTTPTRTAGRPVAKAATNRTPLSFGSSVPKYRDPFTSGASLSYDLPNGGSTSTFWPKASDFLSSASFGFDVGDTRNSSPSVYDDGILRASRQIQPIPTVNTGKIDGGSAMLSRLKGLAQDALASMGSSGDGEVIQTTYGGDNGGGISPWWIAGGAVAAGVLYYAFAK